MVKKLLPWMRALVIITSLVLTQVQMVAYAAQQNDETVSAVSNDRVVTDTTDSQVSDPPVNLNLSDPLRQVPTPGCAIRVSGFAIQTVPASPDYTDTYWGGTPDSAFYKPTPGVPVDLNPSRDAVANASAHTVGETVRIFVGLGNSSGRPSPNGCGSVFTLTNVSASVNLHVVDPANFGSYNQLGNIIYGITLGAADFTWSGTPGTLTNGQIATYVFDFNIPTDLIGDIHVDVTGTATEDTDQDDSYVKIVGPGFNKVSFDTVPADLTSVAPGAAIDYTLEIENTRAGTTIAGIWMASTNALFASQCSGIGNWRDLSDNPITTLAYQEHAVCHVNISVPTNPAPNSVTLIGDLTVSDAATQGAGNEMTTTVQSDTVNVTLPEVAINKRVRYIDRDATRIYNYDTTPNLPVPEVSVGDIITYQIQVRNTGDITLANLFIVDSLIGTIPVAPGYTLPAEGILTISGTETDWVVKPGGADPLVNTVKVTAIGQGTTINVSAQTAVSVDVQASTLSLFFAAYNAGGDQITSTQIGDAVTYQLTLMNSGTAQLNNIQYVSTAGQTVGARPTLPASLAAGGSNGPLSWGYTVAAADPDPLMSTIRIRATNASDGTLVYATASVTLNISNPDIEISNVVTNPVTPTVLRGGTVTYEVTVTNKDDAGSICNVSVDQYLRDSLTLTESLIRSNLPLDFGSSPAGQIAALGTATGTVNYLVEGDDTDPLEMVFVVHAVDCATQLVPLTDRTLRSLDLSDVQINASILLSGINDSGVATLIYKAKNVSAVALTDLSAEYCIKPHEVDRPEWCGVNFSVLPASLASWNESTGTFTYTIQEDDEYINPFIVEVTLFGIDNNGKQVSIKTAYDMPVSTDLLEITLDGPEEAVVGDRIDFSYAIRNLTSKNLHDIRVYNLLDSSTVPAATFASMDAAGVIILTDWLENVPVVQTGIVEDKPVMTMRVRVTAVDDATGSLITANATIDSEIIDMVDVEKMQMGGTAMAGEPITFAITIENQSIEQTLTLTSLSDPIMAGYGLVAQIADFGDGTLTPGEIVSHQYTIASLNEAPDPFVNTFTATGTRSVDGATVSGFDTVSIDLDCPIDVRFSIDNLDDEPDYIFGESVVWTITLYNISSGTISNLTITDSLMSSLDPAVNPNPTWSSGTPGTLAPGQYATYISPSILITSDYIGEPSVMTDVVTLAFQDDLGNSSGCNIDPYELPVWPPVGPYKTADRYTAYTGEVVTYFFDLINWTEANDTFNTFPIQSVTDSLLNPPQIICDFNQDGNFEESEVNGSIGPDTTIHCQSRTRTVLADDPEKLVNRVTAEYPDSWKPGGTLFVWNEVEIQTGSPFVLTKVSSVPDGVEALAGDEITYDYTIANISPYPITGITVVDSVMGTLMPSARTGWESVDLISGGMYNLLTDVPYTIPADSPDPLVNVVTVTGTIHPDEGDPWTVVDTVTETVDLVDSDVVIEITARDDSTYPGILLPDAIPVTGPDGMPETESGSAIRYCFTVTNTNDSIDSYVDEIALTDLHVPMIQTLFETEVAILHSTDTNRLYGLESVTFCSDDLLTVNTSMGDPVVNTAVATGTASNGAALRDEFTLSIDLLGTDLLVSKVPSRTVAFIDDEIEYTIMISNRNPGSRICHIEVTDAMGVNLPQALPMDSPAWVWSGGSYNATDGACLDVDGTATYTYPYTVQANDPAELTNTVQATGILVEDGAEVSDTTLASVAISSSQILVQKTALVSVALPDDVVTYTVSITNIGQTQVKNLLIVDEHYGTQVICPDATSDQPKCGLNINPYETMYLTYQLTMPSAANLQLPAFADQDPYLNQVTVYGVIFDDAGAQIENPDPGGDPYLDPDDLTTGPEWYSIKATDTETVDIINPSIRIAKVAQTLASSPGMPVNYVVTVTNTGQDPLTNITVDDLQTAALPDFDLDAACPNADLAICPFRYGAMSWDHDGDPNTAKIDSPRAGLPYDEAAYNGMPGGLITGERLIGTITVTIPAGFEELEFTNVVEVTANANSVSDRSSSTIDVRDAGITVIKTADTVLAALGSPVNYTLTITNVGGVSFDRLIITDQGINPTSPTDPNTLIVTNGFPGVDAADQETFDEDEEFILTYAYTIIGTDADPYVNNVTVRAVNDLTGEQAVNVASATVDVQAAGIEVDKYVCVNLATAPAATDPVPTDCATTPPTSATVGDVLTYFLHITNPGLLALENIVVTDTLVPSITITWPGTPNVLAASDGAAGGLDEVWANYTYTVQTSDLDPLRNVVTVTGQTPAPNSVQVQDGAITELALVTGDLLITKTAVDSAVVGASVQYTYTVQNLSTDTVNGALANVRVFDPLVTQSSAAICTYPTLAAGATETCVPVALYTVGQLTPRPFVNTATASGTRGVVTISDTGTHTLEILTPGISVTKTADVQVASVGDVVTYIYEITNTGSAPVEGLTVLETDTAIMSDPAWLWPNYLSVGGSETVVIERTIAATDPDPYTNTMRVTGVIGGVAFATEATESVAIANGSLVVENVPSAPYATPAQSVTFTYTLRNLGTEALTITGATDDLCTVTAPTALLDQISLVPAERVLAAGTSLTIYCVQTAALPGPLVSLLRVDAEGAVSGTAISDTVSAQVEVTSGGVLVEKTADRATALVGDVITYTVTVTNIGTEELNSVVFSDPTLSNPLPVPPATLAAGGSFTVTGTYTVLATDQVVTNTATVTATGATTSTAYTDSASVTVGIITDPTAELLLTKSTTVTTARPGEPIIYTLRVQNVSTGTVTAIDLRDNGTTVATIPSLGPGGVYQTTVTQTVPADTTAATYANTADVQVGGVTVDQKTVTTPLTLVTITKVPALPSVARGGLITYDYTITNLSTAELADVVLADSMQSSTIFTTFDWVTPDTGIITIPGSPTPGSGSVTAQGTVTVPASYTGATADNTVEVQIGGLPVGTATASVTVVDPAPLMTVEVTSMAPPAPGIGQIATMTYTVTITNTGNVPLNGLTGTYALTGDIESTGTLSGSLVFTDDSLEVGESTTATATRTNDTLTGPYTFTATVHYPSPSTGTVAATLNVTPQELSDVLIGAIVSASQGTNTGNAVGTLIPLPLQTGENFTVTWRLTNTSTTESLTVTTPSMGINVTGSATLGVPTCTLAAAPTWPVTMPALGTQDVTFTCSLPAGLPEYKTGGVSRIFTLTAPSSTGAAVADPAAATPVAPTAQVTLADLLLDVQIAAYNAGGTVVTQVASGVPVTFRVTLTNNGASRLGCDATEAADPLAPCHLTLEGTVAIGSLTSTDAAQTAIFNSLLDAALSGSMTTVNSTLLLGASATFTTGTYTYTGTGTLNFGVTARGGFFQTGLAAEVMNALTTFDNAQTTLTVGAVITNPTLAISVSPNPPYYGQNVTYTFTVYNPNSTTITGLTGTYTLISSSTSALPENGIVLASNHEQTTIGGNLVFTTTTLAPNASTTFNLTRTESFTTSYIVSGSIRVVEMATSQYVTANTTVTPLTTTPTPTPQGGASTGDPTVEKTASSDTAGPGGIITWTVVVTNNTTGTMESVVMQDAIPGGLSIDMVETTSGSASQEGQLVTLTLTSLAPAASATVTIQTTIASDMTSPAELANTACALRTGGTQVCDTAVVQMGAGTDSLPLTGQRLAAMPGGSGSLALFMLVLLGGLTLMMAAQTTDRRVIIAGAILMVVLAVLVAAVVLSFLGGDEEAQPTQAAEVPVGTPVPQASEEGGTAAPLFQFPPTSTPYIVPTPAGVRYLMIPKLGEQFGAPIPIVQLPIVNEEWDVSGLGQYVGWLEGTTWLGDQWGNTVLAAHVQLGTDNPGPFWGLSQLVLGDEIVVMEGDIERVYVVTATRKVDPNDVSITAPTNSPMLTLITCTSWSEAGGIFAERMVVQAVPATHDTSSS